MSLEMSKLRIPGLRYRIRAVEFIIHLKIEILTSQKK
jgi:hypothetical protein